MIWVIFFQRKSLLLMTLRNSMFYCKMVPLVRILVVIWVQNTILYLRITHLWSLWTCWANVGVLPLHAGIFHNFSLLDVAWGTLGLVSPPTTLLLTQPTSGGPKGRIPPTCNLGGPHQRPQTTSSTAKSTEFFLVAKYMASMRHSWPSITTYNPIPVSAYLGWT